MLLDNEEFLLLKSNSEKSLPSSEEGCPKHQLKKQIFMTNAREGKIATALASDYLWEFRKGLWICYSYSLEASAAKLSCYTLWIYFFVKKSILPTVEAVYADAGKHMIKNADLIIISIYWRLIVHLQERRRKITVYLPSTGKGYKIDIWVAERKQDICSIFFQFSNMI